jgi:hypothetical protein
MGRSLLACFLLFGTACSSYPHPVLPVREAETAEICARFIGPGWVAAEVPANARELSAMAKFYVRPVGLKWYSSQSGSLAACAYTRDPDGCGYGAHYFHKQNGLWLYEPGSFLERICVVG